MKKIILTIMSVLLVGCNQISTNPSEKNTSTYNNSEFNISFRYPSNWEVMDKQIVKKLIDNKIVSAEEKFQHSVVLETGRNESIFFDYESKAFHEYENSKQPAETKKAEIGGFLIEEITMANYRGKKYTEYGIELASINYIIEKNGRFLMFSSESELTKDQKAGIEKILNSFQYINQRSIAPAESTSLTQPRFTSSIFTSIKPFASIL